MVADRPLLDRARIRDLFRHLGERLQRRGVVATPEHLLATRALAARPRDTDDLRILEMGRRGEENARGGGRSANPGAPKPGSPCVVRHFCRCHAAVLLHEAEQAAAASHETAQAGP